MHGGNWKFSFKVSFLRVKKGGNEQRVAKKVCFKAGLSAT
jgi:hypothetical protein